MAASNESSSGVLDERTDVVEINLDGREIAMKTRNGVASEGLDDETKGDSAESSDTKKDLAIRFKDWGFKVDRLFEVAYRFYKRNESKAFHPTFDERNHMNALILQARYGNFDGVRVPDIGVLDLVGKSRRNEWSLLKGMSKTEAMSKFICTLDEICPIFKAYAEAVKLSTSPKSSQARSSPNGSLSNDHNDINSASQQQQQQQQQLQQQVSDLNLQENQEQLKAIHTSLCKQTYSQFKTYAEKQFPNDTTQQKYLISSLQEQYYQQYISQMHPEITAATNKDSSNQDNGSLMSMASNSSANSSIKSPAQSPNLSTKSSVRDTPVEPSNSLGYTTIDLGGVSPGQPSQFSAQQQPTRKPEIPKSSQERRTQMNVDLEQNKLYQNQASASPQPSQVPPPPPPQRPAIFQQKPVIPAFEPAPPPVPIPTPPAPQPPSYSQVMEPPKTSSPALPVPMQDLPPPQMLPVVMPPPPKPQPPQPTLQDSQQEPEIHEVEKRLGADQEPPLMQPVVDLTQQEQRQIDTWSCGSSSGACSPLNQSFSYEPLEPASIWTKKGVHEFKDSLTDDKHSGTYVVKQGILLTIQVPTYPDGRFIHFEFATEDYDIAFGLDFIYEPNLSKPLSIRIQEESEDEDEGDEEPFEEDRPRESGQADLESRATGRSDEHLDRKRAERLERESRTVSIVPTYRRDSHEEVFVGRHRYPGQGYYLLKFDNTYSVLRSKSLFFRICYLI